LRRRKIFRKHSHFVCFSFLRGFFVSVLVQLACATFATFIYSLRSESSKYRYYSLHIYKFRYIRKYYLFVSFAYFRFKIFARIRIQIFGWMKKNICGSELFSTELIYMLQHFVILENIRFKVFVLKRRFCKISIEFYMQANIFFR
jgi:hypothetical protein